MSGAGGGPAALAQGLSPLDGLVVPVLGAYDLAVTFLLPFLAIRLVAAERESGAAKLLAQTRAALPLRLAAKVAVLFLGGLVAALPAVLALLLWHGYGGHLHFPETASVALGHALHALLATAVAFAAAALCRGSASAAIVTLSFTVGTWALDFVAAGREGLIARLAAFTPAAALRSFEHGEVRLAVVAVAVITALAGFAVAEAWLNPFRTPVGRVIRTIVLLAAAVGAALGAGGWRAGWDLSEDRRGSFPRADEAALRRIEQPVMITVHLSAEDPKLSDLERNVLAKLRRVLPHLRVVYAAESRTGLFEGQGESYGEVWYQVGSRKSQLRSTTEPIVLAEIYQLAGMPPPADAGDPPYPGHPLAAAPRGAAPLFFLAWPLAVGLACITALVRRRSPWKDSPSSPPSP